MMHDRAARGLPELVVASDAAPSRNLLLVTSPPTPSGAGVAYRLRELARRRGKFPVSELSAVIGEPVGLSEWSDLSRILWEADIAEVVIAYSAEPSVLRQLAALAHTVGFGLSLAPAHPGTTGEPLPVAGASFTRTILPVPVGAWNARLLPTRSAERAPRIVDIVGALVLAAVALPLVVAAVIAIKLDSPGPAFFSQTRIGAAGRPFRIWKLRTMRGSSEPYARSPADHDPNITPVGAALRVSGFDELPQLLNVLRGEMSLVGPRPEMPFIVEQYSLVQRERLAAVPGITGLWQLGGDRGAAMHEQIEFDFFYIAFRSLALDTHIFLETAQFALRGAFRALAGRRDIEDTDPALDTYAASGNRSAANHE